LDKHLLYLKNEASLTNRFFLIMHSMLLLLRDLLL